MAEPGQQGQYQACPASPVTLAHRLSNRKRAWQHSSSGKKGWSLGQFSPTQGVPHKERGMTNGLALIPVQTPSASLLGFCPHSLQWGPLLSARVGPELQKVGVFKFWNSLRLQPNPQDSGSTFQPTEEQPDEEEGAQREERCARGHSARKAGRYSFRRAHNGGGRWGAISFPSGLIFRVSCPQDLPAGWRPHYHQTSATPEWHQILV